jgi:hypothetical protein
MLKTTIGTSTGSMGKGKVQETMTNFAHLLMGSSFPVMVTSLFQKLVAITTAYTCELFWKALTCTSTSLPVNQSYL